MTGPATAARATEAAAIAPRPLVPTERQLAEGVVVPDAAGPVPAAAVSTGEEHAPRPGAAARSAAYLRSLDPRQIRGSKVPLFVFCMLALFAGIDDAVFAIILPELRAEFGGNVGSLLFTGTAVAMLVTVSAPLFGYLIDRYSRVRLVQASQISGNVVGLAAPLWGRSLVDVTVYRGASGFVGGLQTYAPPNLLPDYYDTEDFSKVLVILPAATAVGLVLAPLLAGATVDGLGGWRPASLLLGGIAVVASLSTLLLREPKRGQRTLAAAGVEGEPARAPSWREGLRVVSGIRTLRRIWFAQIFTTASMIGFTYFLALYWAEVFGLTPSQRGLVSSLAAAAQFVALVLLAPVLGRIAERRPSRIMVIFGAVVSASCAFVVVLVYSDLLVLSVLASIPVTVGAAAIIPGISILVIRLVPADVRGVGITSIGPFAFAGHLLFQVALHAFPPTADGVRSLALTFVPLNLIGGYLLASGAAGVDRDIRAAEAATLARLAAGSDDGETAGTFLVCRDVEVEYQGAVVLDGVDLDVERGEIVALLGTNGAGKSTLLRAICGTVTASNGAIFFDGRNITREPPHLNVRNGVLMVPGGRAVFPTMTVRENLLAASAAGEGGPALSLDQVLELFPALERRLDTRAGDLSGGEQQMVALGQALLMRPRLLMIDELSLGLAPQVVEQLLDVLRDINAQGTTIVLVEQSINVALTIAERAVFMDKGRVRFDGATADLLARPDLVRSVFMGGAATGGAVTTSPRRALAGEQPEPVLVVEDVAVDFGGIRALGGVGLHAAPREVVGVLGPNGAGKTTLFDAISGFVPVAAGQVVLDGVDVTAEAPDARARLGLARSFQDARLFPSMTVRENLAVAFERIAVRNPLAALARTPGFRRSEDRIRRRSDDLIELLGLGPFADKFVSELSTGSRRAVDVAVVMAAEPKVLLLDEPSSGLAQAEVEALGPVIARLARETGAAVLVIEHDLPLLSSVSHRLVAMERGRVIAAGTPAEVTRDPDVLASYLNASEQVLTRSGSPMSTIAAALGADVATVSAGAPAEQN